MQKINCDGCGAPNGILLTNDPFTGESTYAKGRCLYLCEKCKSIAIREGSKYKKSIAAAKDRAERASEDLWNKLQGARKVKT